MKFLLTPEDFGMTESEQYGGTISKWNVLLLSVLHPMKDVLERAGLIERHQVFVELDERIPNKYYFSKADLLKFFGSPQSCGKSFLITQIVDGEMGHTSVARDSILYSGIEFLDLGSLTPFYVSEIIVDDQPSHIESLETIIHHFDVLQTPKIHAVMKYLRSLVYYSKADEIIPYNIGDTMRLSIINSESEKANDESTQQSSSDMKDSTPGKIPTRRKVKDFFKELNVELDVSSLHPFGISDTGDCYVQALIRLTGKSWKEIMTMLTSIGLEHYMVPNDTRTIIRFLELTEHNLEYHDMPPLWKQETSERPLLLKDFLRRIASDNYTGTYLILIPRHMMVYRKGTLYNPATTNSPDMYYHQLQKYLNDSKVYRYIEILD